MSNINFEAALKYIDLGSYDKAVEKLKLAIDEESSKDNDTRATEYHCVLGELYAQLGKEDEAREEFTQVIQFARSILSVQSLRLISTPLRVSFLLSLQQTLSLQIVPEMSRLFPSPYRTRASSAGR